MSNKYKVEIKQTHTYVVDVLAESEEQAKSLASKKWDGICKSGTHHYHETGDPEVDFGTVYDVSNTDDPFNP